MYYKVIILTWQYIVMPFYLLSLTQSWVFFSENQPDLSP